MLLMPNDDTTTPPPELIVLETLKEACEMVRRHNADPEIAKAALTWETRFSDRMAKLQPEALADKAAMAA